MVVRVLQRGLLSGVNNEIREGKKIKTRTINLLPYASLCFFTTERGPKARCEDGIYACDFARCAVLVEHA